MRILCLLIVAGLLAACQPTPPAVREDGSSFPTVTPGRVLQGDLGPPVVDGPHLNPATVVAQANLPTPTPNLLACPTSNPGLALSTPLPASAQGVAEAISAFLTAGGSVEQLRAGLRDRWGLINDSEAGGFVRHDLDLTGEGAPDVIVSLITPDAGGALLIFACVDGRILPRYVGLPDDGLRGEPPRLLNTNDLNADHLPDLVFTSRACDEQDDCRYRTQMATYDPARGRFRNLLEGAIRTTALPRLEDIDGDRVIELIVPLTDAGNADTGPLRTGDVIYDWNGAVYVRSFTQLAPPRFRIQVIHEADAAFAAGDYGAAARAWNQALTDPALENWYNNDDTVLPAYALYRLMMLYTFTGDDGLMDLGAQLLRAYPDLTSAPVYAEMALRFWSAFQASNNLASACAEVRAIIASRPEGLELLNRYGSHSPAMTLAQICPF